MWNPFGGRPACPGDPDQQRWIDGRFGWLLEQFGERVPVDARVVLPTPEFFPDPYTGRTEDLLPMFARIASYINIDSERFGLFFYDAGHVPVAGSGRQVIRTSAGVYIREA